MKTKKALFPTSLEFAGVRAVWVNFTAPPKVGEVGKALEGRHGALLARRKAGHFHAFLTLPGGAPLVLLHRSADLFQVLGSLRALKGLAEARPEVEIHLQPFRAAQGEVIAMAKHLGLGPNIIAYNPPL